MILQEKKKSLSPSISDSELESAFRQIRKWALAGNNVSVTVTLGRNEKDSKSFKDKVVKELDDLLHSELESQGKVTVSTGPKNRF